MAERLHIPGASSRTLLGYLVGLGLVRVVARQADAAARACWRDGAIELHSQLDAAGLEKFLFDRWEPAPVVSPWNGRSGFYRKGNKTAFDALRALEASESDRLEPFRAVIAAARLALGRAGLTSKPEPKLEKSALLRDLRATLPDDAIEWFDAAIILIGDGAAFPPVLGSGGNDGSYDIANNYAQAVAFALAIQGSGRARAESTGALRAALWRESATLRKMSLAHLLRDASPVNSPSGESDALGNPWELCLAVEGTMLLAAGVGRRLADGARSGLVAPFTLSATGAGYGSAVAGEKGKSELWLPLWTSPAALLEIESLFREARTQVGRRQARTGLDAARAAAELGVARGISAFERFSILERVGQSNLAVPAGHIEVRERPAARVLRTLDPWLGRLMAHGAGDIPRSQREALKRLERRAFAVAERGTTSAVWDLLVVLGEIESVLAAADARKRPVGLGPIAPPAGPWIAALDHAIVEVRLAIGLASVSDQSRAVSRSGNRLPDFRDYLHATGFDDRARRRYGIMTAGRVPGLAPTVDRLAGVHERRHQDASRAGRADLGFSCGLAVTLSDLARLVCGDVNERALGALVDGLMLLDYTGERAPAGPEEGKPDPLLDLLALAFHDPRRLSGSDGGLDIPCLPRLGWVARLRAGHVRAVSHEALLRLRLAGMPPIAAVGDLQTERASGPRLAAALLAHPRRADLHRVIAHATLRPANPERQETRP